MPSEILEIYPYTVANFRLFGFVALIFWASGRKHDDVILGSQFTGKIAEIIVCTWYGFTGSMREDDEVDVDIQDLFGGSRLSPAGG